LCGAVVVIELSLSVIPELFPWGSLLLTKLRSKEVSKFATDTTLDPHRALMIERRERREGEVRNKKEGQEKESGRGLKRAR
jgi:hypothetical protein